MATPPPNVPPPPNSLPGELGRVFTQYVRGKLLVCALLWAMYALGFALLGVPGWWVFSFLCGIFNLVPIFGPPVAILFTVLVTWSARGDGIALAVLGIFAGVQSFESFYLAPRILGRRLNVSPWAVLIGVTAGGALFGFMGLLVAVPVLACVLVIWRLLSHRWAA